MICIDTSVWVDFFKGKDSSLVAEVQELLENQNVLLIAPVWIELLVGASTKERESLGKLLSALPRDYPRKSTWDLMAQWTQKGVQRGHRFGMGDLLVGAMAAESDSKVWSLDSDFLRMAELRWVRLY